MGGCFEMCCTCWNFLEFKLVKKIGVNINIFISLIYRDTLVNKTKSRKFPLSLSLAGKPLGAFLGLLIVKGSRISHRWV